MKNHDQIKVKIVQYLLIFSINKDC